MLILAQLSGIQDFLFDVRETGGKQARSLRFRSFRIQLMAECVALRLLAAAGLSHERLLFCAAAKVCIDAAGLDTDGVVRVGDVARELTQRLLTETHGRLRLSVVIRPHAGKFVETFSEASQELAVRKLQPFRDLAHAAHGTTWPADGLTVSPPWDPDTEAAHDADLGTELSKANWLTISELNGRPSAGHEVLGLRIAYDDPRTSAGSGLLSCSNLHDTEQAPRGDARKYFHPRRLARHVPVDERGQRIEFLDLAAMSRGAHMLGVLKADADSLGNAIRTLLDEAGDQAAASLRGFSDALDGFFAGTLDQEQRRPDSPWTNIYTVFSGGDDLLVVGPWDVILDFAAHVRDLFDKHFGTAATQRASPIPLTISAGVAIIKPRYPIHLAARQAEDALERAKSEPAPGASQPKDQCAALGQVWKWTDHSAVVQAAGQLADWVKVNTIQRGWLQTLLQLALLRRSQAGPEYEKVPPAVATSRLAYHIARNWPKPRRDGSKPPPRAWMDHVLDHFDDDPAAAPAEVKYLPAIVRYALLATRSASTED